MHLEHISIINFRNFKEFEYEACRRINCFAGKNGVGKTTILDAIHYLSFSKSFLNTSDKLNISHGEEMFLIQGNFERKNSKELIYCGLKAGQKKVFKRNGKNYDKISDHIGFIPVISLLPSDGNLVFSSGDLRRKFIDMVIAQFDNNYLNDLIHYNRALEHRNKLLKQDNIDIESIEIWDEVLASKSIEIHKARKNFIDGFLESFKNYFKIISKEKEEVSLVYESHISNEHPLNLLRKNFERDRILKHTTTGIHRDDFIFILNNHLLKNIGSQGQQKSYISALKFAQFDFIKSKTNLEPILLLDDVFDKLDAERVELIMKIVSQSDL
ncbi:MAG: DNA replication and repair protein RecF, partial [Bacteroidales bacterium]|nr:DNA replication and repair protein RecF [Bacteroidales bacterium]